MKPTKWRWIRDAITFWFACMRAGIDGRRWRPVRSYRRVRQCMWPLPPPVTTTGQHSKYTGLIVLLALSYATAALGQTRVTVVATYHGQELRRGRGELWPVLAQKALAVRVPYTVMRGADGASVEQEGISGGAPATGVYGFSPKQDFAWIALDYNGTGLHTFDQFQTSTQLRTPLMNGVEIVQGRGNRMYTWRQSAEGWLEGQITIANGSRDIRLVLSRRGEGAADCETQGQARAGICISDVVWNSGIVAGRAELRQPLHAGQTYTLTIDNSQAVVMPKQIAGRIIRVDYK